MTAIDRAPMTVERSRTITWTDPAVTRQTATGQDGYERLRAIQRGELDPPPAARLLGMEIEDVQHGRTVFSLLADELHENPMGTMHGGVIAALVDTAMGCAVASNLSSDRGFTTLELKTNYLRPITTATGRIRAEGWVVHAGGRVVMTEARVTDDDGKLYAHATSTCLIVGGTS
jgi:uncharacterized protein (TIGR00369 family)